MRKTTLVLLIVIACLVFTAVYFAVPTVKAITNEKVLGPSANFFGGVAKGIYASPIWQAYVVPYQFLWGIGLMGVFAIVWWKLLSPKMPTIRKPSVPVGTGGGSSGIRATTPVGATLRPETNVLPSAPLVEEILEETVETKK